MAVLMILRTNYEGKYGHVHGKSIYADRREKYPPVLRDNRYLEVQLSMDRSKPFSGCCYPYKRLVALNESHFAAVRQYDLFYSTTRQRPNGLMIHMLMLVPSHCNCRDWKQWTFLGICPTICLRHHIYDHLQNASVIPRYNAGYFVPPHYHMEVFLDYLPVPKTPRHQLSHHPNIHKCSNKQHNRIQIRAVFSEITNVILQQQGQEVVGKSAHLNARGTNTHTKEETNIR